ncbi:MAG: urea carboxylase-associated family protein [Sphingopyxis sp.]|uniref:urea carboxylase-associated family protein n=1 Tax=Sphingopyxis sp. TaxID=1908224 RepID=UPI001A58C132|nr:urea carboxylase-associated family protein [Sphingopyxis sp.]MBL9066048.1 urea carboxylase-associated family protein [Sphingopyxis sp.]HEV7343593.1 urea carboxylase-associated family protein [Sphingopyxis sp.]
MTDRIAPRSGVAFTLPKDKILCVTDPEGGQVSDLLAFRAADPREAISNGRTFDYEETIRLTTGNRLWSNRSNALLEIVEDSCGIHDYLLTPCSEATFRHFYADKPVHRGCFGNLAEALLPYGIAADAIPVAFNLFMNVPVGSEGKIRVLPPTTKPGDFIRLRALDDLVIGLTACSAYDSCGGSFKPIDYRIE